MPALRVAMIGQRGLPATHGGVERHVEELGAELALLGHEVTVYCRNGYSSSPVPVHRGMRLKHLPSVGTKHLDALLHSLVSTVSAMRDRPDVIHFHAIGPSVWAVLPRYLGHRSSVVATNHGMDQRRAKWGPVARRALAVAAWLSGVVPDATVAPSRAIVAEYREAGCRTCFYVPHGTTPAPVRQASSMSSRFSLQAGEYLLFVGRLVPEKRIDLLLRAFRQLHADVRLVVVGGSSHTDSYVAEVERLAEADARVVLTGYAYGPLLEELFSNAVAFVSASQLEGVPLTVLEAASYGLPLVLSDIPGHLEVAGAVDGPGHRLFEEGDESALVAALSRALTDPERERAGARETRERVLAEYRWSEAALRMQEVYAGAAAQRLARTRARRTRAGVGD